MTTPRKRPQRREDLPDPLAPPPAQADLTVLAPGEAHKGQIARVYAPIEAGLALMREKHGHVLTAPPIVTAENVETIRASLKEMVSFRTKLETTRKAEKEESLNYGRLVDAEAKRIQAQADPIEKVYRDAVQKWDNAEAERRGALLDRIAGLRKIGQSAVGLPLDQLYVRLKAITDFPVQDMQEFREQAAQAQLQAQQAVQGLIRQAEEAAEAKARAEAAEAEAARVKVHQERIAGIRKAAATAREARASRTIELALKVFRKMDPDLAGIDTWQEFFSEAARVYDEELRGLETLLAERQQAEEREAEAERMRARIAELERQQAERLAADQARELANRPADPESQKAPAEPSIEGDRLMVGAIDTGLRTGEAVGVDKLRQEAGQLANGIEKVLDQDLAGAPVKCDGNHGGPACADPECWQRDEPEARAKLPTEGGLFRMESVGQDANGDMVAQLVPAGADEAGAMRVSPDPMGGPGVIVEGVAVATELGFMPAPPAPEDVILHLAEFYDDHPMNIVTLLREFDYAALAQQFA